MIKEFTVRAKPQEEWRLLIATGLFLGGLGGGLFLVSEFLRLLTGSILGIVIMLLGALCYMADLGRPQRFWMVISRPFTSWISRGTVFITATAILGAMHLAPSVFPWLAWGVETPLGRLLQALAMLSAFMVVLYTGFVLSVSPSIPLWNATLLPIVFLVYALLGGMDVVLLLRAISGNLVVNLSIVEPIQILLVAISLLLIGVYLAIMSTSTVVAKESVRLLINGSLSSLFLGGAIIVGLIIPLIVGILAYFWGQAVSPLLLGLNAVLVLIGSFLLRYVLLKAGLYTPPL